MVAALGVAGTADPVPDMGIRMREIAEQIGCEFRKVLAVISGGVPAYGSEPDVADAFHELLARGVIDPGLELFRAA